MSDNAYVLRQLVVNVHMCCAKSPNATCLALGSQVAYANVARGGAWCEKGHELDRLKVPHVQAHHSNHFCRSEENTADPCFLQLVALY